MKTGLKNIAINGALFVTTLLLASLVAEITLRLFAPQTSRSFRFDPIIGYRREPGIFISNVGKTYVVRKHANSAGFMDSEWRTAKPNGVMRIAILGDSMTESIQVEDEEDFESQLEKKLTGRGNVVETLNFGLSGQNTAQEYLTFKEYALAYQPDIAILVIAVTNDPSENHPILNGRGYVPYILFDGDNEQFVPPTDPSFGFPIDSLRSHSHFVRWSMSRAYDARKYISTLLWGTSQKDEETIPIFFQNFLKKRNPLWDEAWEINQKLLEHIKRLADQKNIALMAIVIPDQTQVYDSEWTQKIEKTKTEYPAIATLDAALFDREDPNTRYRAILNKANIPFIDFLDLFRAKNSEILYAPNDVHLNEHGHEYVADVLVGFLIQNRIGSLHD